MSRTMKASAVLVVGCFSLFLMTGCEDDGNEPQVIVKKTTQFPNVRWRLNGAAILRQASGEALEISESAEIAARIQKTLKGADTQIASGLFTSDGTNIIRTPPACEGANCVSGDNQLRLSDLRIGATEYRSVMTHNGVDYAQFRASEPTGSSAWKLIDRVGYTGWLKNSVFALTARAYFAGDRAAGSSQTRGYAYSIGDGNNSNPKTGKAIWTGSMTGIERNRFSSFSSLIHGDVTIRVALSDATANVSFTNMVGLTGEDTSNSLTWNNLVLKNGGFKTDNIQGKFYGSDHGEIGGVFERDNIVGAFGASR